MLSRRDKRKSSNSRHNKSKTAHRKTTETEKREIVINTGESKAERKKHS
jgi:hypothetical protein